MVLIMEAMVDMLGSVEVISSLAILASKSRRLNTIESGFGAGAGVGVGAVVGAGPGAGISSSEAEEEAAPS